MNQEKLTLSLKHHGARQTILAYTHKVIRRFIDFDLMLVESASRSAAAPPVVEPYVTRRVSADEFSKGARWPGEGHERDWAFDREDRCYAILLNSQMIDYQFYANSLTRIRESLALAFPDAINYAYASFTHPNHRGRKLGLSKAYARRNEDQALGIQRQVVWYVSTDNLSSLAVSRKIRATLAGYAGYVKILGRLYCFVSPVCRRAGVSLVATSS